MSMLFLFTRSLLKLARISGLWAKHAALQSQQLIQTIRIETDHNLFAGWRANHESWRGAAFVFLGQVADRGGAVGHIALFEHDPSLREECRDTWQGGQPGWVKITTFGWPELAILHGAFFHGVWMPSSPLTARDLLIFDLECNGGSLPQHGGDRAVFFLSKGARVFHGFFRNVTSHFIDQANVGIDLWWFGGLIGFGADFEGGEGLSLFCKMLVTSVAVHPQRAISTSSMGLLADFSEDPPSITMEWRLPARPTNL